jgi:hypothetical protein
MPNIRQFVYTALKTRLAADSLASISISGLIDVFDIYRPKYLNYYTVSISTNVHISTHCSLQT